MRGTKLYAEAEAYLRRILEPAFGKISGAADPSPSPDGRTIAFTGTKLEKLEGLPISRICLVDAQGGPVREITTGPNDDRLPRWSPDGRRLAFLSDRSEKGRAQLYTLEAEALGEARAASSVPGSVEYHEWSPEGDRILLGVASPGADLAGVQGSGVVEEEKDSPAWLPTVKSSTQREGWRRAWIHEVASGDTRPASREGLNVWEATWLGDRALAAIVSEDPAEDSWYTASLAYIDLEGGEERILYKSEVQLGLAAASPSGGHLAVVEAICSDRLVVAGDLLLIDPEDGTVTPIDTGGIDVTHVRWRDEGRLCYIGIRGLDTVAGELDMRSGQVAEAWVSSETCGFVYPDLAPLGEDAFVTVVQSYRRHPEVAVVPDGSVRALTSLAHEGSAHVLEIGGSLERVSWKGKDGLEIEGLLLTPPGEGPHPLLTWVHGGPIGATLDEWSMHSPLAPLLVHRGYAILYPNPRGSTGRGQAFASMVYGDMGGGDAEDILAGIDAMVERGVADPRRLGVIGGSYGGFMACWLVTRTDRLAAAVAISPVTDWYSQHLTSNIGFWDRLILKDDFARPGGEYFARSPIVHAGRACTPTLLTAGTEDECTPPGQALEFHRALREQGVDTELAIYPGEGHGVRKLPARIDFFARVLAWLERHMAADR